LFPGRIMNLNHKYVAGIDFVEKLGRADLQDQFVFVRADLNVPLDGEKITDDTRIRAILPTLKYLTENEAKVILISHFGRPQKELEAGKSIDEVKAELSLVPVAAELDSLLPGGHTSFIPSLIDDRVVDYVKNLRSGHIHLLENIRFYSEEISEDEHTRRALALKLMELTGRDEINGFFVNEAFGASHRDHASVTGFQNILPSYGGFLMKKELQFLGNLIEQPEHPFLAIVGGAKVSTKIGVIESLMNIADTIILGGAMPFTFLKAKGVNVQNSKVEENYLEEANRLMALAYQKKKRFLLPVDLGVGEKFKKDTMRKEVVVTEIPQGWVGLDVGAISQKNYREEILKAKTVLVNGPLGVIEFDNFFEGTLKMIDALRETKATVVAGGGDNLFPHSIFFKFFPYA